MHLVLRSSKAKGEWSFRYRNNPLKIKTIINKFALKYGVKIHSLANVTRVIQGFKAFLNLRDYIHINQFEGFGYRRDQARMILATPNRASTA